MRSQRAIKYLRRQAFYFFSTWHESSTTNIINDNAVVVDYIAGDASVPHLSYKDIVNKNVTWTIGEPKNETSQLVQVRVLIRNYSEHSKLEQLE